jgi:hypothetical protein
MAFMGHCEQMIIVKKYNAITLQIEILNFKSKKVKFQWDMQTNMW